MNVYRPGSRFIVTTEELWQLFLAGVVVGALVLGVSNAVQRWQFEKWVFGELDRIESVAKECGGR